ncbi:MAG: TIGR03905 family TSCPD domain-containing protein [Clostridia bacterium]|nr:TIGR03905 family TSCPD domain-containing protein [Clostridia bacterium]MBQ8861459.1 TIGR03905 family TSCPD domain-containing protein [Clostridia bacterium]
MSEKFTYKTRGVCSRSISFEIEDGKMHNVRFEGGCHGNTQGLAALAEGMDASDLVKRLEGTDCRGRGTSCPDQLAKAVKEALSLS